MKIKQAIAQLCLKQEAMNRTDWGSKKHQEVQEAFSRATPTLGAYSKPMAEVLTALIGHEIKVEPARATEMWAVVADANGNQFIVLSNANGTGYGIQILAQPDAAIPTTYMTINNSFIMLTGEARQQVISRLLKNRWKDDQIVDWVATKLGGVHIKNFITPVFEAAETL